MIFTLDANVLIDVINGRSKVVRERFDQAWRSQQPLRVSPVALHEVMYGALISKRPEHQMALIDRIRPAFIVEPLTVRDAESAARLRAGRRQAGRPMHGPDALIAGQALEQGWTVVTANVADFEVITGLSVSDWRTPPHTTKDL